MAIFFPPPLPFMGGSQPHAPKPLNPAFEAVPVNNPPFVYGGPIAPLAAIVEQAQPPIWPYVFIGSWQPYDGRQLPPSAIAVVGTNPPFTYGGPYALNAEVVAINQPTTWPYQFMGGPQPYEGVMGPPSQLDVPVNPPPFTHRERTVNAIVVDFMNQPYDPWPYRYIGGPGPLVPYAMVQGQVANNPPFMYGGPYTTISELASIAQPNPWVYAFMGGLQPFTPRKLTPSLLSVLVNNPPFDRRRSVQMQPPFVGDYDLYFPQPLPVFSFKGAAEIGFPICKGYILGQ